MAFQCACGKLLYGEPCPVCEPKKPAKKKSDPWDRARGIRDAFRAGYWPEDDGKLGVICNI